MEDTISRQAAIDALWKALYEYEDKTEKQFQESEDLDVGDWIEHRIFVQNMNDIDRQTILNLPSAQPKRKKGKWIPDIEESHEYIGPAGISVKYDYWFCDVCGYRVEDKQPLYNFCPNCGNRKETKHESN